MLKRLLTLVLAFSLMITGSAFAAAKQMRDGVPVWTEETVRDYATKYIKKFDLDTLWGYYDLQIRRYMPMRTYTTFLSDLEWLTGDFVELGSYYSFQEPAFKTKTHVLHLIMEKQDLDMFFTHKDKSDDWEVMSIEFVLAAKENAPAKNAQENESGYVETEITIGDEWMLAGTLTMPKAASADNPAPAVVLVHGSGPSDRDESVGNYKPFRDIAIALAESGIASLRYDKRTFVYPNEMAATVNDITVKEETIEDAILAGKKLSGLEGVDPSRVTLIGHSMGAMLAPRIAKEANGLFSSMILISGSPKTLLEIIMAQNFDVINTLDGDDKAAAIEQLLPHLEMAEKLADLTEEQAKATTIVGVNAYYFYEMNQYDDVEIIKELAIPTLIIQGNDDFQVKPENGIIEYKRLLGRQDYISYKDYSGLNHFLISYSGDESAKGTAMEYQTPGKVDSRALKDIISWLGSLE